MNIFEQRNIKRLVEVELDGLHNLKPSKYPAFVKNILFTILFNKEKFKHIITKNIEIPQVEFVLTTKCTLRCQDCVNYIPLVNNHIEMNLDDFKTYVNNLLNATSKIHNLILIGGEPLLVKNLNEFLEFVATKRKIKNIYIVSNGTLVPSDMLISAMEKHRKKFTYWLSDYSGNEKLQPILKKEQIFNVLNKHKIKYVFNESLQWNACSPPKDNKRSKEDIIAYYKRCLHPCLSVISGKLTQCPRTSTYLTLGMLPSNILSLDLRKNIKKKDLYEFYNNDYYPSCNYCNFHEDFLLPKVIPAIQKR